MKQFGRTMLTVMGLVVAAAMLSSIPAQAAGMAHAIVSGVGFFNPAGNELVGVTVVQTAHNNYMLFYNVFDFGGGFSAGGFGSIPASSVNVSFAPASLWNGQIV